MRAVSIPAAAVLVTPLLILPGVFFHYDVTPKSAAVLLGAALALRRFGPLGAVDGLLAAQALSLAISTVFSTDPALSLAGSNWRGLGLATHIALLVLAQAAARTPAVTLWRAIAAGGGLAGLYGAAQYFGWDPLIPPASYHVGEGIWTIVRPPGTLGHAGYFAVYLLHGAFTGLAVAQSDPDRRWRRAGAAAAVVAAAATPLTGSRAALLGLAAGAAVLAAHYRSRLSKRHAAAALLAAVLGGAFYFSPAGLRLRARTRWFREDPSGGGRALLWADSVRMSFRRPLAGYGPETYASQFPRFESEELARRFPDRYFESPHNMFVDALAAQGLPGLVIAVALTSLGLWRWRRSGAVLAALTASLVANQFVVFTVPTALLFYVTVTAEAAERGEAAGRRRWLPAAMALALVAVSLAWTDFWLERARAALAAGRTDAGAAAYHRARSAALPGVDTDLWYSRALQGAFAGHPEALRAAERAAQSSEERPNAWYNLAAFYAVRNDFAGTERALRAAIDWAPRWYKPRWMLAQVLEQAGRLEEAESAARRAFELQGGLHPEVRETWDRIRSRRQQK